VIVHAGSDNYGNIPIGDAPDQYTPNSEAATEATAKTGNAGARIACGVIE
jgi:Cu-Zn family superoxide dismutase